MSTAEVYSRLAAHLDRLPGGFPPTASGVEQRILRRLFTEEDASLAVHLTVLAEPARVIARRAGLPTEQASRRLEEMAQRGLIYRQVGRGGPVYLAAQFVVGIWEYQVNDLNPELIRDMNEYLPDLVDPNAWKKAPQLRTIPVQRSLSVVHQALPHEQAEELVRGARRHLVAPCICRREHAVLGDGKGCGKPEDACLVFDWAADYYRDRGIGRVIDREEALEILRNGEREGLVVQPSNARRAINICLCCGCCCQVLKALKRLPRPADFVANPYETRLNAALCSGCGACADRCPMEAVVAAGETATLDATRCIGCGLCVATCPTGALRLERKERSPEVPRDFRTALVRHAWARGKLRPAELGWTVLKSKLDRLLSWGQG